MVKTQGQAAFLLVKTRSDLGDLLSDVRRSEETVWAAAVYGPQCLVAYAQAPTPEALASFVEHVRTRGDVHELDARLCKPIPGDENLEPLVVSQPDVAVLLINVDYTKRRERDVAYALRANGSVRLARAMWGPADIIAVVEAPDHETMRNVICDEVKVMTGVASNTTLYCYPQTWPA